jgi:DNA-binding transcriptional MocR family regulator
MTLWHQARRSARLNPSIIREILKVTEQPGILSLAGGLPSADTFPVQAMREACDRVLRRPRARRCNTPPAKASPRCASGWPSTWARWACRSARARC